MWRALAGRLSKNYLLWEGLTKKLSFFMCKDRQGDGDHQCCFPLISLKVKLEAIFYQLNVVKYTKFIWSMRLVSKSYCGYWNWNIWNTSRKLRKSIRGKKDMKTEKFRTMCKSYWEIQWKSNSKFVWDKNSVLAVNKLADVLSQSKKNQNCLGLTPARCVLVLI